MSNPTENPERDVPTTEADGNVTLMYTRGEQNGIEGAFVREQQPDGSSMMVFRSFEAMEESTRISCSDTTKVDQAVEHVRMTAGDAVAEVFRRHIEALPDGGSFLPNVLSGVAWHEVNNSPRERTRNEAMSRVEMGPGCCGPLPQTRLGRIVDGARDTVGSVFGRLQRFIGREG